jgi:hypothetical protein
MGFIRVIDDCTIGFADFSGNRQYITTGNLAENAKAFLFLMDYARCQRVKLWGHARVVDDDPNLVAQLMPDGYAARSEQAILFKIEAWDVNCPRHIPRKLDAANVADAIVRLPTRIAVLEGRRGMLTGRSYTRANSMASSLSRVMDNALALALAQLVHKGTPVDFINEDTSHPPQRTHGSWSHSSAA